MSNEATRGRYTDALTSAGRRLLHQERTVADVDHDLAREWSKITPGDATQAQADKVQALARERLELINAPAYAAYAASTANRSRASRPAAKTHTHACVGCEGTGVINPNDPRALARLTPAARRAVMAQARAVPTTPAHRSPRERSALAREAGIFGLTRFNILEDDVLLRSSLGEVRDYADKEIERHADRLSPAQTDRMHELVHTQTAEQNGKSISQFIAITSAEPYVSAFGKTLRYGMPGWDRTEARAVQVFREVRQHIEGRAAAESGSFGLAIPWLVDSTILVQVQDNAEILNACRQVSITTDAWHGVSSPGATLGFKGEGVLDVDAVVVLAQPTIPVFSAVGDFSGSFELFMDYPGLVDEVGSLFGSAYRDMVSNYTSVGAGTGSSVPLGLFTAMSNQTTSPSHIKVTSAGSLCANDVRAVFAALPERYQLNASWLASPSMVQAVAALAAPSVTNGLAPHDYVPASQRQPARLLGRPVLVSSYAPSFANATNGQFNWMVCGDFSRYLVVNRLGASLELIPLLRSQTTALPTGERSYFYMARWGAGPVDDQAFRILSNG
jgi:HK97 family phage major capsid protein